MIDYKINVLEELNKKGWSTYKIRKSKLISEASLQALREGKAISFKTLDNICWMLKCKVEDVIYYH